ncbi:Alpha/Beta hydrolase protein [Aspergillus transmontanensis]|uniref:Carboxylic ester hydrolase n=1 Tax=Aspergillus transmontanensis TaxID=1034304 RepID=A0A5N6VV72_9EURO|nr:Alpha/Beta hydrolase protein [Aspergillus transmontanensis]
MVWVKQNIAAFGGNPHDITIMGQSGGGWAIAAHLARANVHHRKIEIPKRRVGQTAQLYGHDQLACFRNTSVPALVDTFQTFSTVIGTDGIFTGKVFGYQGSFGPTIDGVTLTDSVTRLFRQGKIANVPTIAGSTTDEGFDGYINATQNNPMPQNTTTLDPSTNRLTNLTDSQVWEAVSFYPVNASYGSVAPDNFFLSVFKAYWMALGLFGDPGIFGSERMVGRWMSQAHGPKNIWTYRFNAPAVGSNYSGVYPLAPMTHSSDNSYLQSPLASMKDFEKAIALEFRAYISSFICTGDPNTAKLPTAPYWSHYGALGEFVNSPVRLVPQFAFKSNANKTFPTSTQLEVAQKAGIERIDFWQSSHILDSIRY